MNSQSISLFVSCYNEAPSIAQTLKKLNFACTELKIKSEFIIVDDCSTDESIKLIKKFISQHKSIRVKLISNKKNMGPAYSLRKALESANHEYFRWICGDDPEPLFAGLS